MEQSTFVFLVLLFSTGYALVCNDCSAQSGVNPDGCKSPYKRTCDAPNDRCMTLQTFTEMSYGQMVIKMNMEMRNCTLSGQCNEIAKQSICNSLNTTGGLKSCNYSCCEGDLCNSGGPQPTFGPNPVANLSCYECSPEGMGSSGTGEALISCKAPRKRQCGWLGPGVPFDRCMTVKMTVRNPNTSAELDQEARNCTHGSMCNSDVYCKQVNSSGILVKCDVKCCEGNYCNNGVPMLTTTPKPPEGGQTAISVSIILAIVSLVFALFCK